MKKAASGRFFYALRSGCDRLPGLILLVFTKSLRFLRRIVAEICLINRVILVNYKAHYPRLTVVHRPGDHGKAIFIRQDAESVTMVTRPPTVED